MKNENMGVDDLYLAPETEQLEEAAQIAQATIEEEKFLFYLQYDANQKEYLLSILETAGAIVGGDHEECDTLSTRMNMTQLAFIKQLDCVERVKTDEGITPFLAEEAEKDQQNDEVSTVPTDDETTRSAHIVAFMADHVSASTAKTDNIATAIAEEQAQDSGVSVTSVTASVTSSCCTSPTNSSLANAKEISDESNTSGSISCPGAEQWFRFTATRTGKYTIYTTGSLDTIGTLYDCCGDLITEVDDYAPCGKINFRIIQNLTAGATYYVKVRVHGNDTGNYTLCVTERVFADYVTIHKDTITLETGVLYELPITPNYTYKGYNGARRIPGLSVSINPSDADEQMIWWWELYSDVLECSYGWDDDGDRYIHVRATGIGSAKLYAQDWNENGKRDECTVYVSPKVTVFSCSPSAWIESSETMGRDMAAEFDHQESYVVKTPTNSSSFETCWKEAGECIIIHTHGSPTGLYDHGIGSTPIIVSKNNISDLPVNTAIHFIMMTACETAGGTESDNVAYWLSKRINPNGIVIANTDIVSGGSTSFRGTNSNPTWKVYKNGIIQAPIYDVTLTMQTAYNIYELYK